MVKRTLFLKLTLECLFFIYAKLEKINTLQDAEFLCRASQFNSKFQDYVSWYMLCKVERIQFGTLSLQ
jgi:hypothetical protein